MVMWDERLFICGAYMTCNTMLDYAYCYWTCTGYTLAITTKAGMWETSERDVQAARNDRLA